MVIDCCVGIAPERHAVSQLFDSVESVAGPWPCKMVRDWNSYHAMCQASTRCLISTILRWPCMPSASHSQLCHNATRVGGLAAPKATHRVNFEHQPGAAQA